MASSVFPAPSAGGGGGIKAVQRGLAASAGTVTITAVDTTKAFVNVFGTTSSGTVAATGAVNAATGSASSHSGNFPTTTIARPSSYYNTQAMEATRGLGGGNQSQTPAGADTQWGYGVIPSTTMNFNGQNVSLNATNITGGTNNLVAAVVQGYLSGTTSLVVSGACRWEVVEFA